MKILTEERRTPSDDKAHMTLWVRFGSGELKRKHIIQKWLADMETGIIGGPHDFLPPRSDEFQKLWHGLNMLTTGIRPFCSDIFNLSNGDSNQPWCCDISCYAPTLSLSLKHVSTRWLSLHKCLERVLNLWEDLRSYFLSHYDVEGEDESKRKR